MGQPRAQQFTTGGNAAGYDLDSVEIPVGDYENVVVTVSLHSDSSGEPGSSIFNFTNPTSGITADAVNTFTAPANTTLAGSNTPYHIVVSGANDPDESTNRLRIGTTFTGAEDSGGATNAGGDADWEIADRSHFQSGGSWEDTSAELKIRLKGSAKSGGGTPTLSTDATLSGGTVKDGSTTLVTFASGTTAYTASVANGVDEVTFAPTTNHASATVRYLKGTDVLTDVDSTDDGHQVTLDVGTNAITVEVTAEDGTTTQTYTVTVTRAGTTPTLSIADAAGTEGGNVTFTWTLSPAVAGQVTATWVVSFEAGDTAGLDDLDYGALSDLTGTLTIAANETTGILEVPTGIDADNEADETFTMTLSSVSTNATLGTATATGTITNDDAPAAPTDFQAEVGDTEVELSWDAPASGANITRHEFRYKEGAGEYRSWTDIPSSAPEETNEKGYTVTGLTNEVVHTFQLRAVNDAGNSAADEADPVTPTPGICGRTDGVQAAIIYHLGEAGVTRTCAEVNVADLVSFTGALEMPDEGISSLRAGDFAGLTKVQTLDLARNNFTTLPANVFSGMTALSALKLQGGALTALPAGVFSGLPALSFIELPNNDLTSLDADVFDGLTALVTLWLNENDLTALPAGVFSGLTALESIVLRANDLTSLDAQQFSGLTALSALELDDNDLTSLPAGVFDGLTALTRLTLHNNDLTSLDARQFSSLTALTFLTLEGNDLNSLPDGLFTGLTALGTLTLGDNPNTDDDLPLTVTVEKVGTDQVRAKVLAGAPVDVEFTPTLVNVELAASDTKLAVDAGAVDGTAETVTRTAPEAATVDVDLSTQPTLPTDHSGYEFEKAASGLPAAILSAAVEVRNVTVSSMPVLGTDTYGAGERIEVSVTFDEAVNATAATDFVLSMGRKQRMPLVDGSGTATLVFGYTVAPGDEDADGVFTGKEEVTLVGDRDGNPQAGAITSVATGEPVFIDHPSKSYGDHKIDGSRSIVSVEVTSTPRLETDTYGAGETILFTVTFNVPVVRAGSPVLEFVFDGDSVRQAGYVSGSGTKALVFGYTVVSGDSDANGLFLRDESDYNNPDGPVRLDSGDTIKFEGTSTDAPLYWQGRGTQSGHKVDGSQTPSNNDAVLHLLGGAPRGREHDGGGNGDGNRQRCGRQRHGLRDYRRDGPDSVRDRRGHRRADVQVGAELRGRAGPGD